MSIQNEREALYMAFFDKLKETAGNAKEKATSFAEEKKLGEKFGDAKDSMKKAFGEAKESMKAQKEESDALKQPVEGAIIRYEVTYIGGVESIAKP